MNILNVEDARRVLQRIKYKDATLRASDYDKRLFTVVIEMLCVKTLCQMWH